MRISSALFPLVIAASLLGEFKSTLIEAKKLEGIEHDRAILQELYQATNGHAWNLNYGWEHNMPNPCTWTGVECLIHPADMTQGDEEEVAKKNRVIGLYLGDNFLSGRTPASLWKLPGLLTLDLSYNPSLDVDFGSLADLKKHGEPFPPLEVVNIRQTGTTSAKGVSFLAESIKSLVMSDCNFESQFPPDLLELSQLEILSMSGCNLRGSIPDSDEQGISKLSQLRVLDVYDNDFTGTLPQGLASLVHLRELIVSKNQFHGTIPQFVNDDLVMLEQFWANMNDFSGTIPAFDKQPSISKLYLNGNEFTGQIPDTFLEAAITGPEGAGTTQENIQINLGKNEFVGYLPASLDRLENLPITWRFGGNQWTGVAPELCDNVNWNEGSIEEFGCQGLICPPNFYSAVGYYTADDPCEVCLTSRFFGTYECFDRDDRAVLMDIYDKLGGENWLNNDGWRDAPRFVADDDYSGEWYDYCDWYGVECWQIGDAKDYRVRKIELGSNNLVGTMPHNVFSIEHMTTLDVSNNPSLTVSFRHIGMSEHVYSVNVGGTSTKDYDGIQHASDFFNRLFADNTPIAGTIPSEITRIHNLEVLSLQECDLNGELPNRLFAMQTLQHLNLADNNFQGPIPDKWADMVNLEALSLAKNALRGEIPQSFADAPLLKALSLKDQVSKGGGLSGTLPSLHQSRSLTQLVLSDNKLEGELPHNLLAASEGIDRDEAKNTRFHIDLTNNQITGPLHASFERFENLDLFLEGNLITGIDQELCQMAKDTWMSGAVGAYGCEAILCPSGTYAHGGRRKYTDDECLPCDKRNSETTVTSYFGQSNCGMGTDDLSIVPINVADLTPEEIEAATIANQSLERAVLQELYKSTRGENDKWKSNDGWETSDDFCTWYGIDCDENGSVISIQLGANNLKGKIPSSIWTLPNLVHLKLFGNPIQLDFDGVERARKLRTLGLDDTGLTSLEGIDKARSVTKLNIAYNDLSGALPEELSRMANLEILDVSHNKFTGELPSWLKNFVKLNSFSANHNAFKGQLPDFATLHYMIYLDVSNNKFTGDVPPTLLSGSDAEQKIVANLSFNEIEGIVPITLIWMPWLSIQLQGNKITSIDQRLCGNYGWNDFGVQAFGCNGILCPAGTWNALGRQTSSDVPCEECKSAKYMGSTTCGKETSTISAANGQSLSLGLVLSLAAMVLL